MKQPTAKQLETLQAIRDFIAQHGYSPSIQELADGAQILPNAMQCRIDSMERRGLITRTPRISRSIRPTA